MGNNKIITPLILFFLFCFPFSIYGIPTFDGDWDTDFGTATLYTRDGVTRGMYIHNQNPSSLSGTVKENKYHFTFQENGTSGSGIFTLAEDGNSFTGTWKNEGETEDQTWNGIRHKNNQITGDFTGFWNSNWGMLRIKKRENKYHGIYLYQNSVGHFTGQVKNGRLEFTYQETDSQGEGWFELLQGGNSFVGGWRKTSNTLWTDWVGTRRLPIPGQKWLVIIEANWEDSLRESEYAFGRMLQSFFARSPRVKVRHRFFDDAESLKKWCQELAFIPEPVVLSIASHGLETGLEVGAKPIGAPQIADALKDADNLTLLHFSSCLIMKGKLPEELQKQLGKNFNLPISGYTTSVDWGMSVSLEFLYFDMILTRGYTPIEAAATLYSILPLAGEKNISGAPCDSAGFKILPGKGK
jgi:hypothetical protein